MKKNKKDTQFYFTFFAIYFIMITSEVALMNKKVVKIVSIVLVLVMIASFIASLFYL